MNSSRAYWTAHLHTHTLTHTCPYKIEDTYIPRVDVRITASGIPLENWSRDEVALKLLPFRHHPRPNRIQGGLETSKSICCATAAGRSCYLEHVYSIIMCCCTPMNDGSSNVWNFPWTCLGSFRFVFIQRGLLLINLEQEYKRSINAASMFIKLVVR